MDGTRSYLEKEAQLKEVLSRYGAIVIAYSGGVDSTYLADVAHETLGDRCRLLIADSPSMPRDELAEAIALARARGWRLEVIETHEFERREFLQNDAHRCYYCKSELFSAMQAYALQHGIGAIAYGETGDDGYDVTRKGVVAAREKQARAPLAEVGFTKEDIRACSRLRGLPTWNKASFACLASRIPTGSPLSEEVLHRVEGAENVLRDLGFHQYRARHHGEICRIEVEEADMPRLLESETRLLVLARLRALGYRHIALDLAGYRTGSTAG